MSVIFAALLGLIQGLTEFLPVSSSGHLVLAQSLFGSQFNMNGSSYMLFDIVLHMGTLVAVIIAFWRDVKELIVEFVLWILDGFKIRNRPYRRFIVLILVSMVPMFAVLPVKDKIEVVFSSPFVVGICLIITAVILFLSDCMPRGDKNERDATYLDAFLIGIMQAFATIPGISRSGSTIAGGMFRGLDREFSVKFAFIMSLPVIFGANLLSVKDALNGASVSSISMSCYIVGVIVALISGLLAIKMVRYISKSGRFRGFSIYCAIVGIVTIVVNLV